MARTSLFDQGGDNRFRRNNIAYKQMFVNIYKKHAQTLASIGRVFVVGVTGLEPAAS